MTAITESPTGDGSFVAGGWMIAGVGQWPRFWASPDGETWRIVADLPPDGVASDPGSVWDMTTHNEMTVAVGTSIWRSDDRIAWQEVADMASANAISIGTSGWITVSNGRGLWVSPTPE